VQIIKEDDRHFRIKLPVAVSGQFFGWRFDLGKMVRIVGPEDVKEKIKKRRRASVFALRRRLFRMTILSAAVRYSNNENAPYWKSFYLTNESSEFY